MAEDREKKSVSHDWSEDFEKKIIIKNIVVGGGLQGGEGENRGTDEQGDKHRFGLEET